MGGVFGAEKRVFYHDLGVDKITSTTHKPMLQTAKAM